VVKAKREDIFEVITTTIDLKFYYKANWLTVNTLMVIWEYSELNGGVISVKILF